MIHPGLDDIGPATTDRGDEANKGKRHGQANHVYACYPNPRGTKPFAYRSHSTQRYDFMPHIFTRQGGQSFQHNFGAAGPQTGDYMQKLHSSRRRVSRNRTMHGTMHLSCTIYSSAHNRGYQALTSQAT
ncbi:hypothetical protein SPHINGO391_10011 [Sphingomonas aurantiaca]|uniref:Uncharacterized protein n=1 Tax=Sphingomonas aurantiaca TaxID=185949 RepID=A0A5E7XPF3_9SPHN|nr:hypothetical protein SPHINGO391_10011 [Sphingomonas aurantiaca]